MEEKKADYLANIQGNIYRIRKEKGLSQSQVAERAGMKQNQFSRLESHDYDPRISAIYRASKALDIPIQELFRIPNPSDLEANQLIARIFQLDTESREALLKVITGYLSHCEQTRNIHPDSEKRIRELQTLQEKRSND